MDDQDDQDDQDEQDEQDDRMTIGTGNVFRDTGATEPDARLAKVELAGQIMDIVDEQGWSQKDAADRFGIDQPNMSRILSGRLRGFSIERLIQMIANAGYAIQITVERPNVAAGHGSIDVFRRNNDSSAQRPATDSLAQGNPRQQVARPPLG